MNDSGGQVKISAVKRDQRAREREPANQARQRGGENVEWKRLQSIDAEVLRARGISREVVSVIGRWMLHKHLTPLEAEAARRYAYIVARFDKNFTEGRRNAKSPSYERAFGADQEIERRIIEGTIGDYERRAKKSRKHYDKLMKIMAIFEDPITKRNPLKDAIDDMCCSDIEPPSEYRSQIAAALRNVGHEFGVEVKSRRGRPRKGRR